MAEFSDEIKKSNNLTDSDVKRVMALYYVFGGCQAAVDFVDAIDKLHKLGWHHDDEVVK